MPFDEQAGVLIQLNLTRAPSVQRRSYSEFNFSLTNLSCFSKNPCVPHQFGDRVAGILSRLSSRPCCTGWRLGLVYPLFSFETTPKFLVMLFKLSSIISTDKINFNEISEKLYFKNKMWVSEKLSMMFINISKYDSFVVSDYFKWSLIKRRNF
jgi:hypothetical protein